MGTIPDDLSEAEGPVNCEAHADLSAELRTTPCFVCGANLTEMATGNGLETIIKCPDCGFIHDRRGGD